MITRTPSKNPNRLLVVDDNAESCEFIAQVGEKLGFSVARALNEEQFRDEIAGFCPTVIMLASAAQQGNASTWLIEMARACASNPPLTVQKPLSADALEAVLARQIVDPLRFTEQDLRRALDRGQLCVHYQPKVRATKESWQVAGIEALLRWEHPEFGLVLPGDFIGLAEQHGLIGGLTDYVLQAGLHQISEWNRCGVRLELSVNVSPTLVTDLEFPERLQAFLATLGVDAEQLTLEINEGAAFVDPGHTRQILTRLRQKRIGLSLDDFGTGYSSLTQLYKLPFSEMKIDRSIGMDLPHTTAARTIACALIELGHNLGLKVCCEGVESEGALEFLHQVGCDFVQGYFVARPMTARALAAWINKPNTPFEALLRQAC